MRRCQASWPAFLLSNCAETPLEGAVGALPPSLEFGIFQNLISEKGDFVFLVTLFAPPGMKILTEALLRADY